MYQNILLAFDGSQNAVRAAQQAKRLAQANAQSFITIVYVTTSDEERAEMSYSGSSELVEMERRRKIANIETLFKQQQINCKITMLSGHAGTKIIDFAHENNCEVIVVGSRGLNRIQTILLGSVSEYIIKKASCPVLVVK